MPIMMPKTGQPGETRLMPHTHLALAGTCSFDCYCLWSQEGSHEELSVLTSMTKVPIVLLHIAHIRASKGSQVVMGA